MLTNPFDEDLYSKLNVFELVASQYYGLSEVLDAADLYNKALELAESLNDPKRIIKLRRWCGACNYEGGRLTKALEILAPIMAAPNPDEADLEDIYVAIIKYVEIAQEIPVRLSAISKGNDYVLNFLRDTGHTSWEHMYYRKFSELLKARGLFDQALSMAQESWYKFKASSNGPSFLAEEYLYNLVDLCMEVGDLSQAKYFIELWRNEDSSVPIYKEITLLIRESQFMRINSQLHDSVELARKAVYLARQANHYWRIGSATKALIRSLLMIGSFDSAVQEFLNLSNLRHGESLHDKYDFQILRGDLYCSFLRSLGGLPMVNYEYEISRQENSLIVDANQEWSSMQEFMEIARKYKKLALNAYLNAQSVGKNIDALLESDYRATQTVHRIQQITSFQIA